MDTYEKKYKEANDKIAARFGTNVAKEIFSDLYESEDEKVRKALIEMVHDTTGDSLWIDYNVHKSEAIAWLEKQGEQKSQRMISAMAKEAMYDKPAWSEEDEEMLTEIITDVKFAQDEFAKDKNPQSQMNQIIFEEETNWLESIKDRVIPQPKSAWSEDDELVVEDIEDAIINYCHGQSQEDLLDWLKSLKKRIGG